MKKGQKLYIKGNYFMTKLKITFTILLLLLSLL